MAAKVENPVILRELQSLLQQSMGKNLAVVDYNAKSLLGKGENYASTMLKVDATVKRSEDSKEEKLNLVAKIVCSRSISYDHYMSFSKEIFVFEKLMPYYKKFEKSSLGLSDEDTIDVAPKLYGSKLQLKNEESSRKDCDAALIMENLNVSGYSMLKRQEGMDFEHAKVVLKTLARFHAIGIAANLKDPEFFGEVKKTLNVLPIGVGDGQNKDAYHESVECMCEMVCEDAAIKKYSGRIKKSVDENKNWEYYSGMPVEEPWISVMHGDLWVNNILFRQGVDELDVKLVDYQLSYVCSPMKDLPYFLCSSLSLDVLEQNFDELLDVYHKSLVDYLKKLKCDPTPFSRESFDRQLKKDASNEIFHCMLCIKMFTLEASDSTDYDNTISMIKQKPSDLFMNRMRLVVNKFVEKGWLP